MRPHVLYIVLFLLSYSLGTKEPNFFKERPNPIDSELLPYLEKFKELGKKQGFEFKKEITLTFTDIQDKNTIGICHSTSYSRVIEIDIRFYKNASDLQRFALLEHELGHGLCGRGHTHNDGQKYKEDLRVEEIVDEMSESKNKTGFYEDKCPTSLMYPFVFKDECIKKHYDEYVVEIYKNCKPW